MSEIAVMAEADNVDRSPLVRWAEGARAAHAIAQSLVKTSFVPASIKNDRRGNPRPLEDVAGEITAAILTGQEVGLQPMAALRSIDVIEGAPAMRAVAMRGLVQSRGHDVWVTEQTPTLAVVKGRRRGAEEVQTSTWTIDRANRVGVTKKRDGTVKANWAGQPENMLVARATAEACRLIAADVLIGIPYSTEELEDVPAADDVPPPRRTAKRAPVKKDKPEPEEPALDEVDPLADVVVPMAMPEPELEP